MELACLLSTFGTINPKNRRKESNKRKPCATVEEETPSFAATAEEVDEPYELTDILIGDGTNMAYADDWLINRKPPR